MMVEVAKAEPEPEPKADPQYYNKGYAILPYGYKPEYQQTAYRSQYPTYSKPDYHDYKRAYYCDSKATPQCAHNSNATYCLKDLEYPAN